MRIPKETEKLERDFKYLGLDYNNLSIQDTHILKCEIIDTEDPMFSSEMSIKISDVIAKANENGYTTTFQDIKKMFAILESVDYEERDKLLAVLEIKKEQICNMKDAVKYGNNLDCFEYYNNINTEEEYARKLIDDENVTVEEITEYADLELMGRDYIENNSGMLTGKGLIIQLDPINPNGMYKVNNQKEEEEEFE